MRRSSRLPVMLVSVFLLGLFVGIHSVERVPEGLHCDFWGDIGVTCVHKAQR